jgi:hypothetical protein
MKNVIGLFGVCGNTTWREGFMAEYAELGIEFYNPQVADWKPELAQIEAEHLVTDSVVLFPITSETYALGSLAETGFSALATYRALGARSLIVLVDAGVTDALKAENPTLAKESIRARALVKAHLSKVDHPNVHIVDTMEEMLELSIAIYNQRVHVDNMVREL